MVLCSGAFARVVSVFNINIYTTHACLRICERGVYSMAFGPRLWAHRVLLGHISYIFYATVRT